VGWGRRRGRGRREGEGDASPESPHDLFAANNTRASERERERERRRIMPSPFLEGIAW